MAHLEPFRANTVDAPAVYVAISRARNAVALYTDSCAKLIEALDLRDGAQVGAIYEVRREAKMEVDRQNCRRYAFNSFCSEIILKIDTWKDQI